MGTRVRNYQPSDRGAVLDLIQKVWGAEERRAQESLWEWKHARDPLAVRDGQLSVVSESNGELVGYSGTVPLTFRIDNEDVPGAFCNDICTDPSQRGVGIRLIRHQIHTGSFFIGVAAPRSHALWCKLLRRPHMQIGDTVKYVRFTNLKPYLSKHKLGALSGFVTPIWKLYSSVRYPALPARVSREYHFEQSSDSFADLELVWNEYAPSFRFHAVRDKDWFTWRFRECPFEYKCEILQHDGAGTIGYLIYRATVFAGKPIILLVDAVALGDRQVHYHLMVDHLREMAKKHNDADIQTLGTQDADFNSVLRKTGFLSKTLLHLPQISAFYTPDDANRKIYERSGWMLSTADADFEFAIFMQLNPSLLEDSADEDAA